MARVATRIGPVARGCERWLCAPDDFLWHPVIPRFPAGAVNPPSTKPAASTERKECFRTLRGGSLKNFFNQEDPPGPPPETSGGFPGEFPFPRGIYPPALPRRLCATSH